jgi:hypothetical protein
MLYSRVLAERTKIQKKNKKIEEEEEEEPPKMTSTTKPSRPVPSIRPNKRRNEKKKNPTK